MANPKHKVTFVWYILFLVVCINSTQKFNVKEDLLQQNASNNVNQSLRWFPFPIHGASRVENTGEPLLLTPLIKKLAINEARQQAKVKMSNTSVLSYSGFITVNSTYNSNLFFWFFPAMKNPQATPLLLWLNGGSSFTGIFIEVGPFYIDKNKNVHLRETTWVTKYSVIFIDQPVGTGFSFTDDDAGYSVTDEDIVQNLYNFFCQFFVMFPEYLSRPFYITGQSYAGKYIPAFSYKIHQENRLNSKTRINLKGYAIGNGFSDPVRNNRQGEYLYNVGIIDDIELYHFLAEEKKSADYISKEDYKNARQVMDDLILDTDIHTYFNNVSGYVYFSNILYTDYPEIFQNLKLYLGLNSVRKKIHVGNLKFNANAPKSYKLYTSIVPIIEKLLNAPESYKILYYSGNLDMGLPTIGTVDVMNNLNFIGKTCFRKSKQTIWKIGDQIAGYKRSGGNLAFVMVRNAGHFVPYDQPKAALDMLNRFIDGKLHEKNISCLD